MIARNNGGYNGQAGTNGTVKGAITTSNGHGGRLAGTASEDTADLKRRRRPGLWPGMIFALLGMNVVIVGITVYAATSDESFAIEPGYYEKGIAWDQHAAAQRESDRLGWQVRMRVRTSALAGGEASALPTLVVEVSDRDGKPIESATLTGEMFHNARSKQRYSLDFHGGASGEYAALAPVDRTGVWNVRLEARRGGERFVLESSITLSAYTLEVGP